MLRNNSGDARLYEANDSESKVWRQQSVHGYSGGFEAQVRDRRAQHGPGHRDGFCGQTVRRVPRRSVSLGILEKAPRSINGGTTLEAGGYRRSRVTARQTSSGRAGRGRQLGDGHGGDGICLANHLPDC